jgi:hypothetical protein
MLCTPAVVYLVLAIISILYMIADRFSIENILFKTVIIAIWTWFLNFLCSKGHTGISWFLVVLPFLFMIFFILVIIHHLHKFKNEQFSNQNNNSQQYMTHSNQVMNHSNQNMNNKNMLNQKMMHQQKMNNQIMSHQLDQI